MKKLLRKLRLLAGKEALPLVIFSGLFAAIILIMWPAFWWVGLSIMAICCIMAIIIVENIDYYRMQYRYYFDQYTKLKPEIDYLTERCMKLSEEINRQRDQIGEIVSISESLPIDAKTFSEMLDRNVKTSVIALIGTMAKAVKDTDTIFLIRVDHDEAYWQIYVAGNHMDKDQAIKVFERAKDKIEDISKQPNSILSILKIYN
jgi:hypothetical protein